MACIAIEFFDAPLLPEHMHDGFCFLDKHDVQHGPDFCDLVSAVTWLCAQTDDTATNIQLVPLKVLEDG